MRNSIAPNLVPALTTDPADLAAVAEFLTLSGLPTDGLEDVAECIVLRRDDQIVASAALEIHGKSGLLRSVAVHPDLRGQKWGQTLVVTATIIAAGHRLTRLYLITETAAAFFSHLGFQPIDRADVDPAIQQSTEFTTVCPASATVMVLDLIKLAKKGKTTKRGQKKATSS